MNCCLLVREKFIRKVIRYFTLKHTIFDGILKQYYWHDCFFLYKRDERLRYVQ